MKLIQGGMFLPVLLVAANANGQLWKQYADSAKGYGVQKNTDKAIEFYYKAKEELKKDSADTYSYAQICDTLGVSFYRKKQYEKAEPLFLEVKQLWEKILGKENDEYATSCNNLAFLYRRMLQYEKAEPLFLEAKQIREKITRKEHPDYARSCNNLAFLYVDMAQYEKAEPLYLEARQIWEKLIGKQHPDYATSCNNLADLYWYMAQYEKAEPLYLEAKQIREKLLGKEHPDYARTCNNLAGLYNNMGQYEKAGPLYLEAKQIKEKALGKQHPDYAGACHNLAIHYYYIGQFEKAEPLFQEAKQIWGKVLGKEHPNYARSCNSLATLYKDMGHYKKAEPLMLEAKQIWEKLLGKQHPDYAATCNNLALLYREMGQYEKAEPLYVEAKQIREKLLGKQHPDYAASCNNLAIFYMNMGQYGKAEPLCLEAKQIREKVLGKEHPDYAGSCNNLAMLYMNMGQYEKAEPLYLEGKQIKEKLLGKEHPMYARSCNNLAELYQEMEQYKKAEPLLLEAKQIQEKMLGKQHPDYGSSCSNLANLYWLMHQPLRAEKEFKESFSVNAYNLFAVFQFTNEKEKTAFIKNVLGEDDKAYSFHVSEKLKSEQPYSLSLFHRNLILSSSQALKKQLFSANDTTLQDKYDEWMNLKKSLSGLYSKPVAERKEDAAKLEEKAGELEKELTRLSSSFKNEQQEQNITWQTIHQNLKAGEAAIEFVEFHYYNGKRYTDSTYYVALVLRKDKPEPELVPLFEKKQLDSILSYKNTSAGRVQLSYLYTKRLGEKTKPLYELIWKPIEQKLTGIKTVYFTPAGSLHKIAFAALPVNDKEVLSDKYRLVQLNTTASVGDKSVIPVTATDKIILYGGVQYDADSTSIRQANLQYSTNDVTTRSLPDDLLREGVADFYYLSGTEKEVEAISKIAGLNNYTINLSEGLKATEESFKTLSGKNSPAVLHIATHGFFFPDPKNGKKDGKMEGATVFKQSDNPLIRSGLALAGANNAWKGKAVAGVEDGILTSYEVSNMYLPNTKLVVLSACETGLGNIQGSEGVYGLQRAFKMAGVQHLVMSLWKVDDKATSEFMEEFYKNLFAKQTINDAFYYAQTIMKNKYGKDPYKWAAWILVR